MFIQSFKLILFAFARLVPCKVAYITAIFENKQFGFFFRLWQAIEDFRSSHHCRVRKAVISICIGAFHYFRAFNHGLHLLMFGRLLKYQHGNFPYWIILYLNLPTHFATFSTIYSLFSVYIHMVNGIVACLCQIVTPRKSGNPFVLVTNGINIIVVFPAQHIQQKGWFIITIPIHMVKNGRNALRTSQTFSLSNFGIEMYFIQPIFVVLKSIIRTS